ncbi:MAG: succinate dehydrogenase/fumarate reductase iron-sulfur subunit [Methanosarcinales archaeon]|nr:succinate dehydrogenase/fumarate reductase iron-sulfur subunit [Methanosarcinales archaeon]
MKFKIFRYAGEQSRYDTFEIEPEAGMTVLDALLHIQARLDDSLAFRYSCRGAICGSCAMLINKVPRLACRSQVSELVEGKVKDKVTLKPYAAIEIKEPWNKEDEVLVEPLPHLPVIKDLVVDQDKFFEYYRVVEPKFKPGDEHPEKERRMDPADMAELEKYTNCILCAACFGACPVDGEKPEYLGPAALAKLYRFYIDPREKDHESRLLQANMESGWWACQFHGNCKQVCPKDVPPILAIGKARQKLQEIGETP